MKYICCWTVAIAICLSMSIGAFAQVSIGPASVNLPSWLDSIVPAAVRSSQSGMGLSVSTSLRKYFSSFTSYQFPNPFPPNQEPLSRLEFPIEQWFLGVEALYGTPKWHMTLSGAWNVSRDGQTPMQDSDWEDDSMPFQKTVFSESECRLNTGYMYDGAVVFDLPYLEGVGMKAVVGGRRQYFFFTTHDGVQVDLSGGVMELPGDGIEFEQYFNHFYVGGVWDARLPLGGLLMGMPLSMTLQADYAVVSGTNEDLHLLRQGERITRENTQGHCWHIGLKSSFAMNGRLSLELEGDFKRIVTDGSHHLSNTAFAVDFSFHGSQVWSDQAYIAGAAKLAF